MTSIVTLLVTSKVTFLEGEKVNPSVVRLEIEPVGDGKLPEYAKPRSACMDIYAREEVIIYPGDRIVVPAGFRCSVPDGWVLEIYLRSGIAAKTPLVMPHAVGKVDPGYYDEVGVTLWNATPHPPGVNGLVEPPVIDLAELLKNGNPRLYVGVRIRKGDRVAQMQLAPAPRIELVKVQGIEHYAGNRGGGFGSSGV